MVALKEGNSRPFDMRRNRIGRPEGHFNALHHKTRSPIRGFRTLKFRRVPALGGSLPAV
jgi:hypothetical protein